MAPPPNHYIPINFSSQPRSVMMNHPSTESSTYTLFNPYQFQPPTINNFTMNFRNPGSYNCLVDMNPCPHAVAQATGSLMTQAARGRNNRLGGQTQNGAPFVSPPPRYCDSSSDSENIVFVSRGPPPPPRTFIGRGLFQGPPMGTGRGIGTSLSTTVGIGNTPRLTVSQPESGIPPMTASFSNPAVASRSPSAPPNVFGVKNYPGNDVCGPRLPQSP